ncbi:glutathione S-transferase theta-4-like, partial [Teleopsis dalmanni]|uniref:glutathione S-transferase theta-4-like n=1 Tax=Teleopsis dalmanni TaxID=139649 RepID=UPI0018CED16C
FCCFIGEHLTGEFRDKVNRLRKLPAITDHGFQLSEDVAIFRHLSREKLVPEHWYPRKHLGRSRIDEFLAWQQSNMGVACTDLFQQKWLVPYLEKTQPNNNSVNHATKRLEHTLNDFEKLFLNSKKFIIGNNISFADLSAICEIDQPKSIGFNPFSNRVKLARWYESVRDELGPFYKEVTEDFENKLKNAENNMEAVSLKQ